VLASSPEAYAAMATRGLACRLDDAARSEPDARDVAAWMQYLIPGWSFDPERPYLAPQ